MTGPLLAQRHNHLPEQQRGIFQDVVPKEPGEHHPPPQHHFLRENEANLEPHERDLFKEFKLDADKIEDSRISTANQVLLYYAPLRAGKSCPQCHGDAVYAQKTS